MKTVGGGFGSLEAAPTWLTKRTSYPFVRVGEGMNSADANFVSELSERYLAREYELFEHLTLACSFSRDGVLSAFSTCSMLVRSNLQIGKIARFDFSELAIGSEELIIIGFPVFSAIMGDVERGEAVFPMVQSEGLNHVNIGCVAFPNCPQEFSPEFSGQFCFSFSSKVAAIQVLQRSLREYARGQNNTAVVLLYSSIEMAVELLTNSSEGKISARLHNWAKSMSSDENEKVTKIKSLKRKIENKIVDLRGDYAHKGLDILEEDLRKAYEVALDFYWYFGRELEEVSVPSHS